MDMYTNNIFQNNNINNIDVTNNNSFNNVFPSGYQEVSQEDFLKAILKDEDSDKIAEEMLKLMHSNQQLNDKRYTSITTGIVQQINSDGKISVKMLGDDSDIIETVGYINQTPFTINQGDIVKVCKQTAGDKVNSWIIGVNNLNNKKDAFVLLEQCMNIIFSLQKQIIDLKNSITSLTEAYNFSTNTDGETTVSVNNAQINKALRLVEQTKNVNQDIKNIKTELEQINQGKNIK